MNDLQPWQIGIELQTAVEKYLQAANTLKREIIAGSPRSTTSWAIRYALEESGDATRTLEALLKIVEVKEASA